MAMTESSSEALRKELSKAQDGLEASARRVAELESQCARTDRDERIRELEDQIEDLAAQLKESSLYPLAGSPKTQSDDEYIVVEQDSPRSLSFQLKEREAEIRQAVAHAKKLEEMYNAAEARTLSFERQVQVLEANMFEKCDDANALLEKVKDLEELLKAGQIQIAALEEKSKSCDEAQKKVEYEKVLFLETEDQLVKNFRKAHDEAEQYRTMILQLETSVRSAEEKAARAEKCMEVASQRNHELESEIADLNFQLQQSTKLKSESELLELDKALALSHLEQELEIYRGREKKVEDDVRSVDEKTVVHEAASSSHPACEAETTQLTERVKELEGKVGELEGEAKVMEEKASLFEGLKLSYADYTCDLEKRNAKLEAQLAAAPSACELCSQLKTQILDLEVMLGELSLELQETKRREHDAQKELSAAHEQRATEQSSRVRELEEENLQAKASVEESRLWAQEAASLLRAYAQALHEVRGCSADVEQVLGKEEKEALQAKAEELHLQFRDAEGSEALLLCKQLLSLERDCLNSQMVEMGHKNSSLESEFPGLKSQIQALQNPPEAPVVEVKRSFREVTLEGEVQSLRAQLTELQHLRAQVPSLQAQLAQLERSLRAAEKRELDHNLELVKVQRKVSAAEEKVCSLKDTLLNQTQVNELRAQVNLLEQNLIQSEANNASLKEEIDVYAKSKVDRKEPTSDKPSDKVSDEIVLEQASESKQQADGTLQQRPKQKARKRKNRKNGKAPISQDLIEAADRTPSSRYLIAIYFVSVVLLALVIRLSLR